MKHYKRGEIFCTHVNLLGYRDNDALRRMIQSEQSDEDDLNTKIQSTTFNQQVRNGTNVRQGGVLGEGVTHSPTMPPDAAYNETSDDEVEAERDCESSSAKRYKIGRCDGRVGVENIEQANDRHGTG